MQKSIKKLNVGLTEPSQTGGICDQHPDRETEHHPCCRSPTPVPQSYGAIGPALLALATGMETGSIAGYSGLEDSLLSPCVLLLMLLELSDYVKMCFILPLINVEPPPRVGAWLISIAASVPAHCFGGSTSAYLEIVVSRRFTCVPLHRVRKVVVLATFPPVAPECFRGPTSVVVTVCLFSFQPI